MIRDKDKIILDKPEEIEHFENLEKHFNVYQNFVNANALIRSALQVCCYKNYEMTKDALIASKANEKIYWEILDYLNAAIKSSACNFMRVLHKKEGDEKCMT